MTAIKIELGSNCKYSPKKVKRVMGAVFKKYKDKDYLKSSFPEFTKLSNSSSMVVDPEMMDGLFICPSNSELKLWTANIDGCIVPIRECGEITINANGECHSVQDDGIKLKEECAILTGSFCFETHSITIDETKCKKTNLDMTEIISLTLDTLRKSADLELSKVMYNCLEESIDILSIEEENKFNQLMAGTGVVFGDGCIQVPNGITQEILLKLCIADEHLCLNLLDRMIIDSNNFLEYSIIKDSTEKGTCCNYYSVMDKYGEYCKGSKAFSKYNKSETYFVSPGHINYVNYTGVSNTLASPELLRSNIQNKLFRFVIPSQVQTWRKNSNGTSSVVPVLYTVDWETKCLQGNVHDKKHCIKLTHEGGIYQSPSYKNLFGEKEHCGAFKMINLANLKAA